MDSGQQITIACTLIIAFGLSMVVKKVLELRRKKPSGAWKQVGTVTELKLYPIKSCKGVQLDKCRITSIGMENLPQEGLSILGDRRMVVYKEDALEIVSARTYYQMLQVSTEAISEDEFQLSYNGQHLKVKKPRETTNRRIKLWTEQVPVTDAGDEAAEWLQNVVFDGKPNFRLGFWPNVEVRRDIPHLVKKFGAIYPFVRNEFTGAFSDLSSFLLINESSVADLNSRIAQRIQEQESQDPADDPSSVTPTNFRGNIVIKGPSPFEEDEWNWVKIGENAVFRNFKPCTRCSLTTVNPKTSVKDKYLEPITTLRTFRLLDEKRRKVDPSPVMGIYMGYWTEQQPKNDIIQVGDPVYVCD